MLYLLRPDAKTKLPLSADAPVSLGRADIQPRPGVVKVSRLQCQISLLPPGLQAKVNSTGSNPTVLLRLSRDGGYDTVVINQGKDGTISPGDRVALLSTDISEYFELQVESAVHSQHMTTEQAYKRQRTADHAGAAMQTLAHVENTAKPPSPRGMLILCGPPGSGKSTFCENLQSSSREAWERVNQDTINNGKRGTKQQCLAAAARALSNGTHCVVDRCNFDASQRAEFIQLAKQLQCEAHALVLDLPAQLCAQRAAARQAHEGGVQGPAAHAVSRRMHAQAQKAGLPSRSEGLASVQVCRTDAEVRRALQAWAAHSSANPAPAAPRPSPLLQAWARGSGGPSTGPSQPNPAGGQASSQHTSAARSSAPPASGDSLAPSVPSHLGTGVQPGGHHGAPPAASLAGVGGSSVGGAGGLRGGSSCGGGHPSSSGDGAIDLTSPEKQMQPLGTHSPGEVVDLTSPAGPQPSCSPAVAANGASPLAALNHLTAQQQQQQSTVTDPLKPRSEAQQPPKAGAPQSSAGQRGPDGAAESPSSRQPAAEQAKGELAGAAPAPRNAFATMMRAARSPPAKPPAARQASTGAPPQAAPADNAAGGFRFAWQDIFRNLIADPHKYGGQYEDMRVDDTCVLVRDAYPKARRHALVIARDARLVGPADLRAEHLPLLRHMREVAEQWVEEQRRGDPSLPTFKLGFHSVPSMRQLHLHVISQDFDSSSLKHKKHWNSFTTSFFLELAGVEAALTDPAGPGRLAIRAEAAEQLLQQGLRCHRCRTPLKNMPALKQHIATCRASL